MPQPFISAVITNAGARLLTRAQAEGISIEFTRMVIGNGTYTTQEKTLAELQSRTTLKAQKNSYVLSNIDVISDHSIKVTALITNQNPATKETLIFEGYYINEVGLYAKSSSDNTEGEVLYSIAVTAGENGDFMPPYNGYNSAQIIQDYFVTVGNCENVTIHTNNTDAVVLVEDFEKHKKNNIIHITDNERAKWNGVLEEAKDYADATYQQSTGYTDRAIADLIGGAPEMRNTLKELSDAIDENGDIAEALNAAIGKKANQAEVESWLGTKLDTTGDAKGNTVTFTSSDTETPSGWMPFDLFKTAENFKAIMEKISIVGRNLRYIWKLMGNTDISAIGDGTVTGALDSLNSNLGSIKFLASTQYISGSSKKTLDQLGVISEVGDYIIFLRSASGNESASAYIVNWDTSQYRVTTIAQGTSNHAPVVSVDGVLAKRSSSASETNVYMLLIKWR